MSEKSTVVTDEERVPLAYDEAVAMLPDGDYVHTFLGGGMALIGADWKREDILTLLQAGKPELSGSNATALGHGIVAWSRNQPIFIETRKEESDDA